MRIDAEKGIGPELRDKYNLPGFPTIVFIKANGSEVDRIVGYRPAAIFLGEMERINRNEGTIDDLSHQLASYPEDDSLIVRIAEKYEERGDLEAALLYWEKLLLLPSDKQDLAHYKVATNSARIADSAEPLTSYLQKYPSGIFTAEAFSSLRRFNRSLKDTAAEVHTYIEFIDYLERESKLNPGDLNGYAWRMTQLEQNLEDALVKIRQAVELVVDESADTKAGFIDTEAEVLWKLGRIEEAVAVINKCIELQPEDDYFKEQMEKFLKG